jgi:hypothetical protein
MVQSPHHQQVQENASARDWKCNGGIIAGASRIIVQGLLCTVRLVWLGRCPFTAVTGVQISYGVPFHTFFLTFHLTSIIIPLLIIT